MFLYLILSVVPQPLSLIPVSMLNTGKLTELKAVPDNLLESLLVSKVVETIKARKPSGKGCWATAVEKNELHRGSLCLVGVPFRQKEFELLQMPLMLDETNQKSLIIKEEGKLETVDTTDCCFATKFGITSVSTSLLRQSKPVQLLELSPGETVELLGPFAQEKERKETYFYGRSVTGRNIFTSFFLELRFRNKHFISLHFFLHFFMKICQIRLSCHWCLPLILMVGLLGTRLVVKDGFQQLY